MRPDFSVQIPNKDTFTILQITDMQVIDAGQQRYPERLCVQSQIDWATDTVERNCYAPIRTSVSETKPDLIVITGDIVYGEFDDAGTALTDFLRFMGSFGIPWAPVYGNHDNESARGVDEQCAKYANAENCLFARGSVTGNCNYTVGLYDGDDLVRVLYMMDSNACYGGTDPKLTKRTGPAPDQIAWMGDCAKAFEAEAGHPVPGFVCMHIPPMDMADAVVAAGYQDAELCAARDQQGGFSVGAPAPECDHVLPPHTPGDCGCKIEEMREGACSPRMERALLDAHADGVFAGHFHQNNLSVAKNGIRYTCGVKCGYYDYRTEGQLGCTKITFSDGMKHFAVTPIYHD